MKFTSYAIAESTITIEHSGWWTLRLAARPHWVDWQLYETTNCGDEPREYWKEGERSAFPGTLDLDEAECEIEGFVKWDGCHEFHVDGAHGCGADDAATTLRMIAWAMSAAWRAMRALPDASAYMPDDTMLPDGKVLR